MAKINTPRSDTIDQWRLNTNQSAAVLGDIDALVQTNVVAYTNVVPDVQIGTPTSLADFTITNNAGVYEVTITNGGAGYQAAPFDLVVYGSQLGGIEGLNDATISVTNTSAGAITAATIAGTPSADLIAEYNATLADKIALETLAGSGALDTSADDFTGAINEVHGELDIAKSNIGTIGDLTTTATDLTAAVNELDGVQGDDELTTTASTLTGAINELDARQGDDALTTTAQDLSAAINEHESDIGTVANLNTTSKEVVGAINELRLKQGAASLTTSATSLSGAINEHEGQINTNAGDITNLTNYTGYNTTLSNSYTDLADAVNDLHTRVSTNEGDLSWGATPADGSVAEQLFGGAWDGSTQLEGLVGISGGQTAPTSFLAALNYLYAAQSVAEGNFDTLVLKAGDTMTGSLSFDNNAKIIASDTHNLVFATHDASNVVTDRISIADGSGAVTISADVSMTSNTLNASTLQEAGTSLSSKYGRLGSANTWTNSQTYTLGSGESFSINGETIASDTLTVDKWVKDTVGEMVSSNTESGITVTYQSADGTLDFNVADPTITLTGDVTGSATMTNLGNVSIATTFAGENFMDEVAPLFTSGVHTGIGIEYDDANNRINFSLTADPTITLTGDVTGSGTMTDLGDVSITATVADNSHAHTTGNITGLEEYIEDTVNGALVAGGGLTKTYDDTAGTITFDPNDPTFELTGVVTAGPVTQTNLGNVSLATSFSTEDLHDAVAPILTAKTHTGISATYDDDDTGADGIVLALTADPTVELIGDVTGSVTLTNLATATFQMTTTVTDGSHDHTASNISDFESSTEAVVAAMVSDINTESGITVTVSEVDQGGGDFQTRLNFDVNDPTFTLTGDVTAGPVTMTNLGNVELECSLAAPGVNIYNVSGTKLN